MNTRILSIPKAAEICNLNRVTLWKYVKSGELKASQTPGGQYRIHRRDLERFMRGKGMYPFGTYAPEVNRILIADDDPGVRALITRILGLHGYVSETAHDGFQTGIKVMSFKPGLILLDLFIPGMNGFEICKQIKNDPDTAHITVLAITGYDTEDNRSRILKAGADGYLAKPIEEKKMMAEIKKVLRSG